MRKRLFLAASCVLTVSYFTPSVQAGNFTNPRVPAKALYSKLVGWNKLNNLNFDQPISGRVTSETGEPLIGVTVVVKGTTIGAATDVSGNYTLSVPDNGGTLVFSYIGYLPKEVVVGSQSVVNVTLTTDAKALEEVVVIGYGTQKKSVVTGAITSVKSEELENQQISRVEQALQGRTSGLTIAASSGAPGAASTVRVRGTTSLNGNASNPLYVVDGIPIDIGGIDYLNQNDIESIEVLKDAASAAIYGARSAAGVILITTKKGKAGSMQVAYNAYYGTQAPARKLNLLNATEYATLRNEASVAGGGNIIFTDPQSLGEGTDWQDIIFNNDARIQNHDLSISGGNDKSTYYASFGYFDQEGIVATDISRYQRFNVRFNSTHKINKWLNFGNNLSYSHLKNKGIGNTNGEFGGVLSSAINLDPLTPAIVTDPTMLESDFYNVGGRNYVQHISGYPYGISTNVLQEMSNPLAYIQTRLGNFGWSDNMVGNVYFEVAPIKGLKLRTNIGGKLSFYGSESFTPLAYFHSSMSNTITSFYRENNTGLNYTWENTASYTRDFGNHHLTGLVGTGAYVDGYISRGLNATYQNIPATTFEDANLNLSVPAANRVGGGWDGVEHKISSLYGRVTYDYNEKYLFTGIVRRDGSTRFGRNYKYGYFPSASVGWVPSRENFWPTNNVVDFLKLRLSYGVNGTDEAANFAYVSTVSGGRNYTFGDDVYLTGYSPNAPENPDLKWEETHQTNFGIEATLFQNFNLVFDLYRKRTVDILAPLIIPGYVGAAGNPTANIGAMNNDGYEIELGYTKQIGDFNLNLKGNVSHLRNEITDLGSVAYTTGATVQSSDYEISRNAVGHPIGSFYGFETNGIFQTQEEVESYTKDGAKIQPNAAPGDFRYVDLNNDGVINADDRTFIGDPTPTWSYGFTANVGWRNFDFLAFGQGVAGNEIYNGLRRLDIPTANWTTDALGRWTGAGTSNDFPRMVTGDPNRNFSYPTTFRLSPGDYFRIKTLQLGYTLPKIFVTKVGFQRVRLYVSSNNLLTFTKYAGFDPEIGGGSYGVDRGYYPQSRSFLFGVNVSF